MAGRHPSVFGCPMTSNQPSKNNHFTRSKTKSGESLTSCSPESSLIFLSDSTVPYAESNFATLPLNNLADHREREATTYLCIYSPLSESSQTLILSPSSPVMAQQSQTQPAQISPSLILKLIDNLVKSQQAQEQHHELVKLLAARQDEQLAGHLHF